MCASGMSRNQRISHFTKGFCCCVSYNLFVVVWNSPSRAELRTRIDDLSEAEEYVVFVSVCSGQMCSCNFSVSKNFLRGLECSDHNRSEASLQWKEGKKGRHSSMAILSGHYLLL
jgi:hypothetical protein